MLCGLCGVVCVEAAWRLGVKVWYFSVGDGMAISARRSLVSLMTMSSQMLVGFWSILRKCSSVSSKLSSWESAAAGEGVLMLSLSVL